MSWGNAVGITKKIRAGRSCFEITAKTRRFFISPIVQEQLWHQLSPSVEVTHEEGHVSTPVICLQGVDKDSLPLY